MLSLFTISNVPLADKTKSRIIISSNRPLLLYESFANGSNVYHQSKRLQIMYFFFLFLHDFFFLFAAKQICRISHSSSSRRSASLSASKAPSWVVCVLNSLIYCCHWQKELPSMNIYKAYLQIILVENSSNLISTKQSFEYNYQLCMG